MKINLKLIVLSIITSLAITACDDGDKIIDDILATVGRGAVLRTVDTDGELNKFDLDSFFSVEMEEQDVEDGGLLEQVEVFIGITDNDDDTDLEPAERSILVLPASAFSPGEFGLPRASFSFTFGEALDALGLDVASIEGGETIDYRLELTLTDGQVFSTGNTTNTVSQRFFSSPFEYKPGINCFPPNVVTGDYTLLLTDTEGDGWTDGAVLTVTIDGTATEYVVPAGERGATFTISVPDGSTSLEFNYTQGSDEDTEEENGYMITSPFDETAASESSEPDGGPIRLNICTIM